MIKLTMLRILTTNATLYHKKICTCRIKCYVLQSTFPLVGSLYLWHLVLQT